jgi:hypothetical protein
MKIKTVLILGVFMALATNADAQRGGRGGGGGGAAGGGRPSNGAPPPSGGRPSPNPGPGPGAARVAAQRSVNNLPSSPILPMGNPVAPAVQYGGPAAARRLGNPAPVVDGPVYNGTFRARQNRRDVVVVGAPYYGPYYSSYYDPYFDPFYYDPYRTPPTIPGQLPGVYRLPEEPASELYAMPNSGPIPNAAPTEPEITYYSEPNIIITPPQPDRVVEPPTIGTSKAELLLRYGQPWGSFRVRGQEILSFTGGLSLVLEDGKVTQIK